ncbi:MAG: FAD-binding oxidoreductase [Bacteroidetes bacterium]|nr:FAD-binding oxidoreductase [Bacteroidota bacterium]
MNTEVLVIGQGISGTWLSYYLEKNEIDHFVIDQENPQSASRQAGGLINPVTGRNKVKTWMADQLLPFCLTAYQQLGACLDTEVIDAKTIIECFTNSEAAALFSRRVNENPHYLEIPVDHPVQLDLFHNCKELGLIKPAYVVNLPLILSNWRARLRKAGKLGEYVFDPNQLVETATGFNYQHINCKRIIFCDGASIQERNAWANIPLAPTKGEALVLKIKGLPSPFIYKNKLTLLPLAEADYWWVGSSYEWAFEHAHPSSLFKEQTIKALENWLAIPFEVIEQRAAIRMGTMERRPLVGFDSPEKKWGLLNGMGTKGCSLAPYFAFQLVENMLRGSVIDPEANWTRFQ